MPDLSSKLSATYNEKLDLVNPSGIRSFDQKKYQLSKTL